MSHSLNEIEAMAKKAARGAGMSWGLCEEVGKAVRWLESHKLPGVASFVALCRETDGQNETNFMPDSLDENWKSSKGALGPIYCGATLNDVADRLRDENGLQLTNMLQPLLLVPFAAWGAIHLRQPIQISWGGTVTVSDGYKLAFTDTDQTLLVDRCAMVNVTCTDNLPDSAKFPSTRGDIDPAAWEALAGLAQRTYAPATEESRRLGAGAGVSDND